MFKKFYNLFSINWSVKCKRLNNNQPLNFQTKLHHILAILTGNNNISYQEGNNSLTKINSIWTTDLDMFLW